MWLCAVGIANSCRISSFSEASFFSGNMYQNGCRLVGVVGRVSPYIHPNLLKHETTIYYRRTAFINHCLCHCLMGPCGRMVGRYVACLESGSVHVFVGAIDNRRLSVRQILRAGGAYSRPCIHGNSIGNPDSISIADNRRK